MNLPLGVALLLALGIVACGGDDGGDGDDDGGAGAAGASGSGGGECNGSVFKSCTQVDSDGVRSECLEVDSSTAQPIIDACAADEGATVSSEPCDRTDSQGGCLTMISGTCQIVWDYDAASPANYQAACEMFGGTYVPLP